jgi:mRNA interferase RelE/StbE
MRIRTTPRFDREYARLPEGIQARADKQFGLLLSNSRHPSLRMEKVEGYPDICKARITRDYRLTFFIQGDTCILRRLGKHDILRTP